MNENKAETLRDGDGQSEDWLAILSSLDKLNGALKEPGWYPEDRDAAYKLKDDVMFWLLDERPEEVSIELLYVPYIRYCEATKDKAGRMMRADGRRHSFDYYLQQIEPTVTDIDVPEKALIEMVATVAGAQFCFHIPAARVSKLGIAVEGLPQKRWIDSKDFHRRMLRELQRLVGK